MIFQKLYLGIVLTALGLTVQAAQTEIVIESMPDGQRNEWFKVVEGNWMESASKSKAPGLTATKAKFKTASSAAGSVRFIPDIPVAGKYEVFATYPDSGNAVGVIYKIHSADGDKEVILDQRGRDDRAKPPSNVWFSLGTYQFAKGQDGYVEIRDPQTGKGANDKEPNVRVYADAVKFVPVGFELPPEFAAKVPGGESGKTTSIPPSLPVAPTGVPMPKLADAVPTASSSLPSLGQALEPTPQVSSTAPASSLPPLDVAVSSPNVPSLPPLGSMTSPASTPLAAETRPSLPSLSGLPVTQTPAPSSAMPPPLSPLGQVPDEAMAPSQSPLAESGSPTPALPPLPTLSSLGEASSKVRDNSPSQAASSIVSLPGPGTLGNQLASPQSVSGAGAGTSAASLPTLAAMQSAETPIPGIDLSAGMPSASVPLSTPMTALVNASTPQPTAPAASEFSSGLPWIYDEGSAHAASRNSGKKVLVFFVARGNKVVEKYDKELFNHPAVLGALNKFVLLRIDFPQNTKAGYKLQIFGAGNIAVTDSYGQKLGAITQVPATPEELAAQLEALAAK